MPIPATGPSAEVQAEYSTEYARRGLQRYPGPVDADNVDHLILSGDHVLDDILGQGEIATEFAKLLEEGNILKNWSSWSCLSCIYLIYVV